MPLDYLQRGFLGSVWPQAIDLLSNEIIHNAFVDADRRGFDLRVSDTSLNMSALPLFSLLNGQLKLRMPGTGAYGFRTRVLKRISNFPDLPTTVTAKLTADMTIDNRDEPIVNVGVSLDSGPLGDIADWFTGWEDQVKSEIKKGFGDHLGFFSKVRYDTSVSVTMSGPELVYGSPELSPQKAIDIVLVSDGFTASNMGDFRTVVDTFKTQITTSANNANEPFFSLRSAIRIWKLEVLSTVPTHLSHRVVTGYDDAPTGSRKTALANLARLDKVGTRAETVGADVVVFMSDRATFGGDARAMAMGSVVMLPVSKDTAARDAAVLQHELGHTVLGNLADEYIEDVGIPHNALSSIRNTTESPTVGSESAKGEAILFVDSEFRGAHKHIYTSDGRLDFADRASSIVVLSGNWQLFRDSDFRTPYPPILGPGLYPSLSAIGIGNDAVSGIRHTTDAPTLRGAAPAGQLVLFENAGFEGAHTHIYRAEPRSSNFGDRASSLVVVSSNWQLFQDADFNQPFAPIFGRGRYPELTSLGLANDAISSVRPSTLPSSVPGPLRRLEGQVVLFESRDFDGSHKHVYGPEPDLDFADRTSSIAVLAGTWRGYEDKNFARPYSSVLGPGLYRDLEMPYHGKEPIAPNVTRERPNADNSLPAKWAKWAQNPALLPEWDVFPIESFQGARYHGAGLWRPAENCKMRHSRQDMPFCAVCREALTLGMRNILGSDVFVVEYTYPSRNNETKRAQVGPADSTGKLVHRVAVPQTGAIEIRGSLVAGTLPEPWSISMSLTGTGPLTRQGQDGFSFTARFGDVLRMTISSRTPFVPGHPLPTLTLDLRCDLPLSSSVQAAPSIPAAAGLVR